MKKYHKIQTVYKRDPASNHKSLLIGDYSNPEFEYLADNQWVFTEKVDGTNIRVCWHEGKITFKGKTDNAAIPAHLIERLIDDFLPLAGGFEAMFGGVDACLYGEGYGPKIQKGGGNYGREARFVLFDAWVDGWWLRRTDVDKIAMDLKQDIVPIIGTGTLHDMVETALFGIKSCWGDFQAEGIVARPATELVTRAGGRIITKIKCRDFTDEAAYHKRRSEEDV